MGAAPEAIAGCVNASGSQGSTGSAGMDFAPCVHLVVRCGAQVTRLPADARETTMI